MHVRGNKLRARHVTRVSLTCSWVQRIGTARRQDTLGCSTIDELLTRSVATTNDCTCGLWRHLPRKSPLRGLPSQLIVGPTSLTSPTSREVKGSVQCTRPWVPRRRA